MRINTEWESRREGLVRRSAPLEDNLAPLAARLIRIIVALLWLSTRRDGFYGEDLLRLGLPHSVCDRIERRFDGPKPTRPFTGNAAAGSPDLPVIAVTAIFAK